MKLTIIISGFPGVGKTHLTSMYKDTDVIVHDSDSSQFSWLEPGVRNPDFPRNYIEHIKGLIGKADYILVSSHKDVRNMLAEENIMYALVYPTHDMYQVYMDRYKMRNSNDTFIDLMSKNFHSFVDQCKDDDSAIHIEIEDDSYLTDVLSYIREVYTKLINWLETTREALSNYKKEE